MELKDIAKQVQRFAPLLGTALGGPAGGALGAGVSGLISIVGSAFGMTDEQVKREPALLASRIATDPESEIKLLEIQTTHKTRIEELLLESDKAYLADRQDARKRQVDTEIATGKKDWNLYILAWTIVVGFFVLTGCLMFAKVETSEAALILFGSLSSGFGAVVGYFFGSSKSSADKTVMMSKK